MYMYIYTCHTLHDTSNILKLMYYHNTTKVLTLYLYTVYCIFNCTYTLLSF